MIVEGLASFGDFSRPGNGFFEQPRRRGEQRFDFVEAGL